MSYISTRVNALLWPCGCWQIESCSTLHLCAEHQCSQPDATYWQNTPTKGITLRVVEERCCDGNDPTCPTHGVAASNARQNEFFRKHSR